MIPYGELSNNVQYPLENNRHDCTINLMEIMVNNEIIHNITEKVPLTRAPRFGTVVKRSELSSDYIRLAIEKNRTPLIILI